MRLWSTNDYCDCLSRTLVERKYFESVAKRSLSNYGWEGAVVIEAGILLFADLGRG